MPYTREREREREKGLGVGPFITKNPINSVPPALVIKKMGQLNVSLVP